MPEGSFHPETVLFRPGGVNLQGCLCGVPMYASAQSLDFLARTKNPSFPNWKLLRSSSARGFALARIVIGHGRAPSQKRLVAIGAVQDHLDEGQTSKVQGVVQGCHQFRFSPHDPAEDLGLALQRFRHRCVVPVLKRVVGTIMDHHFDGVGPIEELAKLANSKRSK